MSPRRRSHNRLRRRHSGRTCSVIQSTRPSHSEQSEESSAFESAHASARAKSIAGVHEAILGRRSARRCIVRWTTCPRRRRRQSRLADAAFLHAAGPIDSLVVGGLLSSLLLWPHECVVSRSAERIGAIKIQRGMHGWPVVEVTVKEVTFDAARADGVVAAVEVGEAVLGGRRFCRRAVPQERYKHRLNRGEPKYWTKAVASHLDTHFDYCSVGAFTAAGFSAFAGASPENRRMISRQSVKTIPSACSARMIS